MDKDTGKSSLREMKLSLRWNKLGSQIGVAARFALPRILGLRAV